MGRLLREVIAYCDAARFACDFFGAPFSHKAVRNKNSRPERDKMSWHARCALARWSCKRPRKLIDSTLNCFEMRGIGIHDMQYIV